MDEHCAKINEECTDDDVRSMGKTHVICKYRISPMEDVHILRRSLATTIPAFTVGDAYKT